MAGSIEHALPCLKKNAPFSKMRGQCRALSCRLELLGRCAPTGSCSKFWTRQAQSQAGTHASALLIPVSLWDCDHPP